MDFWCLVCPVTCLQIQQKVGPVKSACHICPVQVSMHKASLQSKTDQAIFLNSQSGNDALCQAIIYGAKVRVHGVKRVAEQCTHHGSVGCSKAGEDVGRAVNT